MISLATPDEVSELTALVNSAYRGEHSRKGWTTEADLFDGARIDEAAMAAIFSITSAQVLKYVESKKILGCLRLDRHDDKLYLSMFSVSPLHQAQGIGKKLMAAAEIEARRQACRAIDMTVISVRSELIDWYHRRGYRDTGERRPLIIKDPNMDVPKKELSFVVLEKSVA